MPTEEIRDDSDWTAPDAPQGLAVDLPSTTWPLDLDLGHGSVGLFDLDHPQPARFYATNRGVTRGYLDALSAQELPQHISMGYTNLAEHEQVAVALGGALLRLWPARATGRDFVVLVPPSHDQPFLSVRVSNPVRFAVRSLRGLSARMPDVPLLLSRELSSVAWR